ncbi:MAG: YVTN family beta-propeller repeat-containing protein [Tannerellaceae bacterium]|nr:YVTN family beta-propeller repeat-containing protein [Tannerellaceae bacterium]
MKKLGKLFLVLPLLLLALHPVVSVGAQLGEGVSGAPMYPTGVVVSSVTDEVFVAVQSPTPRIAVYPLHSLGVSSEALRGIALAGSPTGLALSSDASRIYVTTAYGNGTLSAISSTTGATLWETYTGRGACAPVAAGNCVYVCNRYDGTVSEVSIAKRGVRRCVAVLREPVAVCIPSPGRYLFVANLLPVIPATADTVAAAVTVIDINSFQVVRHIMLANGANALRGICPSPDGDFVYVTHNIGHFGLPATQLHQGWMNTAALAVIDAKNLSLTATVPLDEAERGAPAPWGIAADRERLYITHSGTHDISIIDRLALHRYLRDAVSAVEQRFLPPSLRRRMALTGNSPRTMALTEDRLLITTYFSDHLNTFHIPTGHLSAICLNPQRRETVEQAGERHFNDATHCAGHWQSCNACHPAGARVDGLNWDLTNDGVGNPKNTKSLLFSHVTPPNMITGVRATMRDAVRAGFTHIQFTDPGEPVIDTVAAYLSGLRPVVSPSLLDAGRLSRQAKAGRKIFVRARCADCHNGPYYTDCRPYPFGYPEEPVQGFDTPTLRELWRTAPYLFDGRAPTIESIFTIHRHGIETLRPAITPKEIQSLTQYLRSL